MVANVNDAAFDAWWEVYPRKVGKPAARKAFAGAIKRSGTDPIFDGLNRWLPYWAERAEPEFVPHPSTWLNQERYNDTPPAPSGPRATHSRTQSSLDRLRELGEAQRQHPQGELDAGR